MWKIAAKMKGNGAGRVYRIGVDIGGTFTDFALFDDAAAGMAIHKRLTTPDDPAAAVLEGCRRCSATSASRSARSAPSCTARPWSPMR